MLDNRGVKRGMCKECVGECEEYLKPLVPDDMKCLYCLCPPTKHEKVLTNDEPSGACNISESKRSNEVNESMEIEQMVLDHKRDVKPAVNDFTDETMQLNLGKSLENENSLEDVSGINLAEVQDFGLPKFSPIIQSALANGSVVSKGYWNNFTTECCLHYINFSGIDNRYAYEKIGMTMINKYPCLKMAGRNEWFQFTKCLSSKIRKERHRRKQEKNKDPKGFLRLAKVALTTPLEMADSLPTDLSHPKSVNASGISVSSSKAICNTNKKKSRGFSRSNFKGVILNKEKELEAIQNIKKEWSKSKPDKAIVKALLKETYANRTAFLKEQEEFTFPELLKNYPFFDEPKMFLFELRLTLGSPTYDEFLKKTEIFVKVLKEHFKADLTFKGERRSFEAWGLLEKTISCLSKDKELPIIKHVERENFKEEIEFLSEGPPMAVVVFDGNSAIECAVVGLKHEIFLKEDYIDLSNVLILLVAEYYSLELNFPKEYIPPMSFLSKYLLGDTYYKFSAKVAKFDCGFRKNWPSSSSSF